MRDLIILGIVFSLAPVALFRPYVGVLLWTWISVMNPHKLAWGLAFDFPVAQVAAIPTLIGVFITKDERRFPINGVTVTLILFILWMCITSAFAIHPDLMGPYFSRAMKIQLMILVTLLLIHGRDRIEQVLWVLVISVGFYGVKAGIYTLMTGGGYGKVFGPPGGFFEENNALALTTIMTIPLMFYLYQRSTKWWIRWGLMASVVLCAATVFGTTSRGGLLAIVAMAAFLLLKSHNKALMLLVVPLVGLALWAFMPEQWHSRMSTIGTYEEDASAMGRINAWWMAWNLAKDRFFGGGFEVITPELFARYAPNPLDLHAAHSIYFQVLGEHGFVGLGLFLLLWFLTWRRAGLVLRAAKSNQELAWAGRLAAMIQVSLVGYFVGGAFLSLAYFDLPYDLMVLLVAAHVCVQKQLMRPRADLARSTTVQPGAASGG